MRHGKKFNHLGRKSAHRKAMLTNMANSLIEHKKITTTVAKAKALRKFVEPLITKAKNDTTHSRRVVFSYLQNKETVKELFGEIAVRVADRPGGYTRILKLGNRAGDNAEMAFIELVDYNELAPGKAGSGGRKKRRRRGGSSGGSKKKSAPVAEEVEEVIEDAVEVAENVAEEVVEEVNEVAEDAAEVVEEVAEEVEEAVEEVQEEIADATDDSDEEENKG